MSLSRKDEVVPYGTVPTSYGIRHLEPGNVLSHKHQKFAREAIPIDQHLVLTVPSNVFATSTNSAGYFPVESMDKNTSDKDIARRLWALFGRVAYEALQSNYHKKNDDEEDDDDVQFNDDLQETVAPPLCYETEGKYAHRHGNPLFANFDRMTLQEQEEVIDENDFEVVSISEYQERMLEWQNRTNPSQFEGKGEMHVVIEFLRGKVDHSYCTAYRLWILKEKGAVGNLNEIMGNVIASADTKPKDAPRDYLHSYSNIWRKIGNQKELAQAAGLTLYKNISHFNQKNIGKVPLTDPRSSMHPTNIFSVGSWRSIIHGTEDRPKNVLPQLFDRDTDVERFKEGNYFADDMVHFRMKNFRNSMYYCLKQDLAEDVFLEKFRLDLYIDTILPMLLEKNKQVRHKCLKPEPFEQEKAYTAGSNDSRFNRFEIVPSDNYQIEGQGFAPSRKRDREETMADQDFVFIPGECDQFLYLRRASDDLMATLRKEANKVSDQESLRKLRLKALKRLVNHMDSLFAGTGNENVSLGLRGILKTQKTLMDSGFSSIFMRINPSSPKIQFQDNLITWLLQGFEFNLYISHLQCELYWLLINVGCAYSLTRNKTNINFTGPHGTGKSMLLDRLAEIKCPGVCTLVTTSSLKSDLFGGHKTFEIILRNEPKQTSNGKIKNDVMCSQSLEIEKSMLSEQSGSAQVTVFNKNKSRYEKQISKVILSCVVVQCQNYSVKENAQALQDRFTDKHIFKCERAGKSVHYMQQAQKNRSAAETKKTTLFQNQCRWLDAEFGKMNAMSDMVGGLSEPNMDIFTDVRDFMAKKPAYAKSFASSRAMNRCANLAKTQIQYDSLMILLFASPTGKSLQFFIEQNGEHERFPESTPKGSNVPCMKELREMYDDSEQCNTRTIYKCEMFKTQERISCRQIPGCEVVNCKIDLIHNRIYSIDEDDNETFEADLKRKWEYNDAWRPDRQYKQGDRVLFHYQGKEANYASYIEKYTYKLPTNKFWVRKYDNQYSVVSDEDEVMVEGVDNFKEYSFFAVDLKLKLRTEKLLRLIEKDGLTDSLCKNFLEELDLPGCDVNDMTPREMTDEINKLLSKGDKHLKIFNQIWQIEKIEDRYQIPESFLGKYKDECLGVGVKERQIEMWRDLDLLQYCTVDIAIRTFAMMRDEFLPAHVDKIRTAIAHHAKQRLKGLSEDDPYKLCMPKTDLHTSNLTSHDVICEYVHLGKQFELTFALRESLVKLLNKGVDATLPDMMVKEILDSLLTELVEKKFGDLRNPIVIIEDPDNGDSWNIWSDDNRPVPWQRNHEHKKKSVRVPVLKVNKNRDLYIHIAWVSDLLHTFEKQNGIVKDAYLQDLSSYRYPSTIDESKRVLTASPWVGEVLTHKNKKTTTQLPSISSYIDIKSKKNFMKSTKRLNERSSFAERLLSGTLGRKEKRKKSDTEEVEYIRMSYDRHVACKHARNLNEHDEKLGKNLYKKFKHLSKQDLLEEMEKDPDYQKIFNIMSDGGNKDFPNDQAVQLYELCLDIPRKRKQYSVTKINALVRRFLVRCRLQKGSQ